MKLNSEFWEKSQNSIDVYVLHSIEFYNSKVYILQLW